MKVKISSDKQNTELEIISFVNKRKLCIMFGWIWSSISREGKNVKSLQTDGLTDGQTDKQTEKPSMDNRWWEMLNWTSVQVS